LFTIIGKGAALGNGKCAKTIDPQMTQISQMKKKRKNEENGDNCLSISSSSLFPLFSV